MQSQEPSTRTMPAEESSVVGRTLPRALAVSGPAFGLPWLRTALAVGLSFAALSAQEFRISRFSLAPNPTVEVEGDVDRYYILYRNGAVVDTGRQPAALGLGIPGRVVLEDRTAADSDAARFYRVEARPLTEVLDLDGDGIDDVFELRNRSILDPLDRADALRDPDADGLSNLEEYRNKTDPQVATVLTVPDAVPAEFASGQEHFVALRNGGTLWTWAYNRYGQLGVGWAGVSNVIVPVQVSPGRTWKTVAAGAHHTMAITSEGRLFGWGRNVAGQLGDTTTQDRFEPVAVAPDRRWTIGGRRCGWRRSAAGARSAVRSAGRTGVWEGVGVASTRWPSTSRGSFGRGVATISGSAGMERRRTSRDVSGVGSTGGWSARWGRSEQGVAVQGERTRDTDCPDLTLR